MVDNDSSSEENGRGNAPVTPAPRRSQTNLASRAPGPERAVIAEASRGIPQAASKPPPDASLFIERRRIADAVPASGELPEPSARVGTQACETAPETERRGNLRKIGAECLLALICVLTGTVAQHSLDHRTAARPRPGALSQGQQQAGPAAAVPGLPDDASAAFTTALDDLDSAVEDLPQQSPEQILKTVSRSGRGCVLAWKGDYPSVVFGSAPIPPNSLAANLEGCAQAVKRLPR